MATERLQKVLSQAGLGSRREMERWIQEGKIKVNGKPALIGMSVSEKDRIIVRGKLIDNPLDRRQRTRVLLYHKPLGEISSRHDPKHQRTVFDQLPPIRNGRWIQVGRLDINTSGLMIFTNNGELANFLMHPSNQFEREYAVRVHGEVPAEAIQNMLRGVELDDGKAAFSKITFSGGEGSNSWYHVVLNEGRNREVRRIWQTQGLEVSRLIRVRYANIPLPRFLSRGRHIELEDKEVASLLEQMKE
ncbi:MAG: pseudouridine synthase [Legionellaceae bacterium]|nr:pseudouridine synthase [Legionellaceae bacterium]